MFNELIKAPNRMISVRVSFDNTVLEREDIYMFKTSKKGSIMTSVMETAELEIFGKHDVEGKEIKVEVGTKTIDMADFVYKDYGLYIVDQFEYDDKLKTTRITKMYDKMVLSMVEYEDKDIPMPLLLGQYLRHIANNIGLELADRYFTNYDLRIERDIFKEIPNILYRDVFDEFAQAIGGALVVEGNRLRVVYPTEHKETINKGVGIKDISIENKFGEINTVASTKEIEDVVYIEDAESVKNNGRTEIKIPNNEIFNQFDREIVLKGVFDRVKGLEYYPAEIETSGLGYYDIYDMVHIEDTDGNHYDVLITGIERTFDGGFKEKLFSEIPDLTETDYNKASKTDRDLIRTQAIVNKQDHNIQLVIEDIKGLNNDISSIELSLDEILLTLEQTNYNNLWSNSSGILNEEGYSFDVKPIVMNDPDYPLIMGVQDYVMGRQNHLFKSIEYLGLAEHAFKINREGKALSLRRYLTTPEELYFHVKVKGKYKSGNFVSFDVVEMNSDLSVINKTNMGKVIPNGDLVHLKKSFKPRNDTKYVAVEVNAKATEAVPIIFTEGVLSLGDYLPFHIADRDNVDFVKSQIQMLENTIKLQATKVENEMSELNNRVYDAHIEIDAVKGITSKHSDQINYVDSELKIAMNNLSEAQLSIEANEGLLLEHTKTIKTINDKDQAQDTLINKAQIDINANSGLILKHKNESDKVNETQDAKIRQAQIDINATNGLALKHENELHSAVLEVNANNGITAKGRGFELQDTNGNRKVYFNSSTGEYTFDGRIFATSGQVGGWDIGTTTLSSGTGNNSVWIGAGSWETALRMGGDNNTDAPFVVYKDGRMKSTSGEIGGWTIGNTTLSSGRGKNAVWLNTASDINYAIRAGGDNNTDASFVVYKDGSIKSSSGTIGGWDIGETTLSTGTGSSSVWIGAGSWDTAIRVGGSTNQYASFVVYKDGRIKSTSGEIGGWTIGNTTLSSGSGRSAVWLNTSSDITYAIRAGGDTNTQAPFVVYKDGSMKASNATITGSITATSGTFTGGVYASYGTIGGYTISGGSLVGNSVVLSTNSISINGVSMSSSGYGIGVHGYFDMKANAKVDGSLSVYKNLEVLGTKNATVPTRNGLVKIHAYETPTAHFGDIGGVYVEDEEKVYIDEVFSDTIHLEDYHVFLSVYSDANVYVSERNEEYFVLKTDKPTEVSWEIKGIRRGFRDKRLERSELSMKEYAEVVGDDPQKHELMVI